MRTAVEQERGVICYNGPHRPCLCPHCPHHLWEVAMPEMRARGLWEMPETCALDVYERGEQTQDEVAALLGCTRQRVSQIEEVAIGKLRRQARRQNMSGSELEFEKARVV